MSLDFRTPAEAARADLRGSTYQPSRSGASALGRLWGWLWPKALAVGIVVAIWEFAYLVEWRPSYVLPSPADVWSELVRQVTHAHLWKEIATTLQRGLIGYTLAILIGTAIGIAVVQWRTMRLAVGSLIAGMQTMPSIAWFPLAILLFGLTDTAIQFVVVLGAAPSIASGVIAGIDEVPPPLLRAGKMLGATGFDRYRHVVLPAAMPTYLMGLKQGWAFSWRSLLAGELLVIIAAKPSLGGGLSLARTSGNASLVLALMVVILVIGMLIDGVFSHVTRRVREKRGLTGLSAQ